MYHGGLQARFSRRAGGLARTPGGGIQEGKLRGGWPSGTNVE